GGPTDHLHPAVTTRTHEKGHVLLELTPVHPVHPGHVRGPDQETIPQPTQANTNPPHQRDDPGQGRNTEEHPQHRMIDHPAQPRAQTQHHQYQQWPPVPMPPDPSPHATPSAHDPPRHRSVRIIRTATHGRAVHTMPGTRTTRRTPHPDRSPVDDGSARRRSLPQWSKAPHMPAHAVERPRCPRPPNTLPDGGEPPSGPLSPHTATGGPVADREALDLDPLAVSDRVHAINFTRRDDHVTYLWSRRAVDHLREVHQVRSVPMTWPVHCVNWPPHTPRSPSPTTDCVTDWTSSAPTGSSTASTTPPEPAAWPATATASRCTSSANSATGPTARSKTSWAPGWRRSTSPAWSSPTSWTTCAAWP